MIKLLIADDHAVVREGLKQIVSETSDIIVVDEACNGQEILDKVWKNEYGVILLDISLPGRSGLEVLEDLKRHKSGPPVLILSMHPEEQYAIRALKSGAAGYLTKESAPNELVKAIRKVSSGGKYISVSLAEKLADNLGIDIGHLPHETLSNREFQTLCLIASGKTVKEIAGELSLSTKTISTYRERLLEKMKMQTTVQLIRYAMKHKLVE